MNSATWWFFYIFLFAEFLNIIESILFFVTTWAPTRYEAPESLPGRTVDVFIATYNEPLELLRETVLCSVGINYPHKTFILDDGNREEVKQLAREFGCEYITRIDRSHAKAGNLNNALRYSGAEFVVTLDADHVPSPALIDAMIGFFRDNNVALVQAAQDFYNLDSFQHRLNSRTLSGWQQQELFFSVIQPGKDRFNAAFYCGSPAIIRRSALDEVGGFATETITEDMHTSLRMQKNKHKVIYYNRTLAYGLAPQTYLGFSTQWRRWGRGCMQVARCENPIFGRGLTFGQRLCYFASIYFYWMSYQKLLFILTPVFALFTGIFPLVTTPKLFAWYFLPFLLANVLASALLQGGLKSYLRSEEFNILKMHILLSSPLGLIREPGVFKVTPKSRADAARISDVIFPVLLCVLLGVSILAGLLRLGEARDQFAFWALCVNMAWSLLYLIMMSSVVLSALKRQERRFTYRFPSRAHLPVVLQVKDTHVKSGSIVGLARDINRSGLSVSAHEALPIGTELSIQLRFPKRTIRAEGQVTRHNTFSLKRSDQIAHGVRFTNIRVEDQDEISRYLFWRVAPHEGLLMKLTESTQREG